LNRWLVVATLASASCSGSHSGTAADAGPAQDQRAIALQRANDAWNALKANFGNPPGYPDFFVGTLRGPFQGKPAFVWGEGEVVHAALNLAKLTGDYADFNRVAPTLSRYLLTNNGTTGFAPPADPGTLNPPPPRWWDDNGLTCATLMKAQSVLPGHGFLATVLGIWPFLESGQWPDGGQHENEAPGGAEVATVATAMDDETAERLHLATATRDPRHAASLDFALKNDARIKSTVRAPGGLYWDAYYPDIQIGAFKWCDGTLQNGVCSGTWWACNPNRKDQPPLPASQLPTSPNICGWSFQSVQGLMIGSDVLLYRITGDASYLASAGLTAGAALDRFTPDWLFKNPPEVNSQFFAGLMALDYYAPDARIRATLATYLDRAWVEGRNSVTGLFTEGGIGVYVPADGISALDQAGFVILYTLLAWPADSAPDFF
jgi:hypothetical protein